VALLRAAFALDETVVPIGTGMERQATSRTVRGATPATSTWFVRTYPHVITQGPQFKFVMIAAALCCST